MVNAEHENDKVAVHGVGDTSTFVIAPGFRTACVSSGDYAGRVPFVRDRGEIGSGQEADQTDRNRGCVRRRRRSQIIQQTGEGGFQTRR